MSVCQTCPVCSVKARQVGKARQCKQARQGIKEDLEFMGTYFKTVVHRISRPRDGPRAVADAPGNRAACVLAAGAGKGKNSDRG